MPENTDEQLVGEIVGATTRGQSIFTAADDAFVKFSAVGKNPTIGVSEAIRRARLAIAQNHGACATGQVSTLVLS